MDHDDTLTTGDTLVDEQAQATDSESNEELVDELLIEEISIDGMCGVY